MIVSIPFPKRWEAFSKTKITKQWPTVQEDKKTRKWKQRKKCNSLQKEISRSSKKKENPSTPNTKTNKLIRRVGINPRDAPEIENSCFLPKLYLVRYGKPEKKRKIVNKAFVQDFAEV